MLAVEPGSDTTQLGEVRSLLLRDTAVSIYSNRSPLFVQRGGVTGEAVIVTGAAQGIGLGIAMEMARCGAKVVMADINEEVGQKALDKVKTATKNPDVIFCHVDVTSDSSVKNMVDKCVQMFGGVRVLVNNAAMFVFGNLRDGVTDEEWKKCFDTNVIGYGRCIKDASAAMRANKSSTQREFWTKRMECEEKTKVVVGSQGSIVNMASMSSFIAQGGFVPYSCSKGAVAQMTRCTALDFVQDNIRVNCVAPGTIETPALERFIKSNTAEGATAEQAALRKAFAEPKLMKRLGVAEEVAAAVIFLASVEASFMTGEMMVVDGGQTIH